MKTIQADCPSCDGKREVNILGEHTRIVQSQQAENDFWSEDVFRILQCRGCLSIFFQKQNTFSEDYEPFWDPSTREESIEYFPTFQYWPPKGHLPLPNWLPELRKRNPHLEDLVVEVYSAFNTNLLVVAAIGTRTVFEKTIEALKYDSNLSFAAKLSKLLEERVIGKDEYQGLKVLIDAGNASAHRGFAPTLGDLKTCLEILNAYIHRTFILNLVVRKFSRRIPQKKGKKG